MSPGPPAGSSWRWIRGRRPEPEKSDGDRFGQASDDAIHDQVLGRQRSGQPLKDLEPAGRGHEGRRGDRRAADHFRRIEPLTTQRAEEAAGLAGDRPRRRQCRAWPRPGTCTPAAGWPPRRPARSRRFPGRGSARGTTWYRRPASRWSRGRYCPGHGSIRRRTPGVASHPARPPAP